MAKKHSQKTIFFSYNDFADNRNLLDNIIVPKKYQHALDKIKTGTFTKGITDTEKKLMEESFKFQLDNHANNELEIF